MDKRFLWICIYIQRGRTYITQIKRKAPLSVATFGFRMQPNNCRRREAHSNAAMFRHSGKFRPTSPASPGVVGGDRARPGRAETADSTDTRRRCAVRMHLCRALFVLQCVSIPAPKPKHNLQTHALRTAHSMDGRVGGNHNQSARASSESQATLSFRFGI